eukprot:366517-Chlamydomonas_euryale.AAC.5
MINGPLGSPEQGPVCPSEKGKAPLALRMPKVRREAVSGRWHRSLPSSSKTPQLSQNIVTEAGARRLCSSSSCPPAVLKRRQQRIVWAVLNGHPALQDRLKVLAAGARTASGRACRGSRWLRGLTGRRAALRHGAHQPLDGVDECLCARVCAAKTEVTVVGRPMTVPTFKLSGKELLVTDSVKYLGLSLRMMGR